MSYRYLDPQDFVSASKGMDQAAAIAGKFVDGCVKRPFVKPGFTVPNGNAPPDAFVGAFAIHSPAPGGREYAMTLPEFQANPVQPLNTPVPKHFIR